MRRSVRITNCLFLLVVSAIATASGDCPSDSIQLSNGAWLIADVVAHNTKAVHLDDGRVVMYGVISQIRTCDDTLVQGFTRELQNRVEVSRGDCWQIRFRPNLNPVIDTVDNRFFSDVAFYLHLMTTKAGALELQVHYSTIRLSWAFVDLAVAYGRTSADIPRVEIGSGTGRPATINYDGYLLSLGLGVQQTLGLGRLEISGSVVERFLSPSMVSSGDNTLPFSNITQAVGCATLRYVLLAPESRISISLSARFHFADVTIAGEQQRFSAGIGVGLRL